MLLPCSTATAGSGIAPLLRGAFLPVESCLSGRLKGVYFQERCGIADTINACKSGTLALYFSSRGFEVPVLVDFAAVFGGLNIAL
ncbi:hypothetical protein [Mariprofundus ferrooxydans]|uniref:hypothetical protein n=1 Tax=Mariprofundus ferrooxydans TaxID=314344 RepID=UPI0003625AB7|nr:hypothetical protein [Mariprofundus ferrooxydans]